MRTSPDARSAEGASSYRYDQGVEATVCTHTASTSAQSRTGKEKGRREREREAKERERGNGERKEGRRKVGGRALHDAEHGAFFFSERYHDTEPKCFARARASCHHAARAAACAADCRAPPSVRGGSQSPLGVTLMGYAGGVV